MIKCSYLVKGKRKFILVVKSQSKYLAGQHFDRGRRLEYRIYRSVTPLHSDVVNFCYDVRVRFHYEVVKFHYDLVTFRYDVVNFCYDVVRFH